MALLGETDSAASADRRQHPCFRELAAVKERELHELYDTAVKSLETRLADRDGEVLGLRGVMQKLQEDFLYNLSLLEQRDQELDSLEAACAEATAAVGDREARLDDALAELKAKAGELDDLHAAAGRREDRHREEILLIRRECEEECRKHERALQRFVDEAEARRIHSEEQLAKSENDMNKLRVSLSGEYEEKLTVVRDQAEKAVAEAAAREHALQVALSTSRMAADAAENWRKEVAETNRDLEKRLRTALREKKDLESVLLARIADVESAKDKVVRESGAAKSDMERRLSEMQKEKEREAQDFNNAITKLQQDLSQATADQRELTKCHAKSIEDYQRAFQVWEERFKSLEDEKVDLAKQLGATAEERDGAERKWRKEVGAKVKEIQNLNAEVEKLSVEVQRSNASLHGLEAERSKGEEIRKHLAENLEQLKARYCEETERLRHQLVAQREELNRRSDEELSAMMAKISFLENQLREALDVKAPAACAAAAPPYIENANGVVPARKAEQPDREFRTPDRTFDEELAFLDDIEGEISRTLNCREGVADVGSRALGACGTAEQAVDPNVERIRQMDQLLYDKHEEVESLRRAVRDMRQDMERILREQKAQDEAQNQTQACLDELERLSGELRDARVALSEKQSLIDRLLAQQAKAATPAAATCPACSRTGPGAPAPSLWEASSSGRCTPVKGVTAAGSVERERAAAATSRAEELRAQLGKAVADLKRLAAERARLAEAGNALRAEIRGLKDAAKRSRASKATQTQTAESLSSENGAPPDQLSTRTPVLGPNQRLVRVPASALKARPGGAAPPAAGITAPRRARDPADVLTGAGDHRRTLGISHDRGTAISRGIRNWNWRD